MPVTPDRVRGSICLLLLGAGLAFRMRPDRPFETAASHR
jgi:hypothetical protein